MTTNGDAKLDAVFGDEPALKSDLMEVCEETETMLQAMKDTINIHAEILAAHRHILDKFVPKPLLAQAYKEYYEARKKAIEVETGTEAMDAGQAN
jgi:hypothetical protein